MIKKILCLIFCVVLLINLVGCDVFDNSRSDEEEVIIPEGSVRCSNTYHDWDTDDWYQCTHYTDASEIIDTYDEMQEIWKVSSWKIGNSYSGYMDGSFSWISGLIVGYGSGYISGELEKDIELTFWQVRDDGGTELTTVTVEDWAKIIRYEENENIRIEKHKVFHDYWQCVCGYYNCSAWEIEYRVYAPKDSMVLMG